MSAANPDTQIEFLKGVGPQRAESLRAELGIFVFNDLLHCFPFRHVDRTKFYKISEIREEFPFIQVKGKLSGVQIIGTGRHQRLVAELTDETGVLELVWFQGIKWVKPTLQADTEYIVFGKPALFNRKFNIAHPEIEKAVDAAEQKSSGLQPIYSSTEKLKAKGLESKGIAKLVRTLLTQYQPEIEETLPQSLIGKIKMVSRKEAIHHIHFPPDANTLAKATFRLKFEELFFNQLRYLLLKTDREQKVKGHVFSKVGDYFNTFYNNKLPFQLTNAQKRVIKEIRLDLGSGRQMNRLLQGDVGSGKTLVALMCMLIALDNGCQSCIMAPTEILASQHYETITQMLDGTGVRVGLLTGSTKTQERKVISEMLSCGEMHIIIGTHALIEDKVQFNNLGFCVIDEQHKFGVAQRAKLWKKNDIPPHVLVMTATPIPRTLAMTVYGDLDRSTIDELPPGRRPIKTIHVYEGDRLKIFNFMREQIKQGRQVYVVYPLIEESEKLDLKHLELGYEEILKNFPQKEYGISIVHGRMKADVKDFEMKQFAEGRTKIMVSTTVIEVGINVPNATVMVIENAERFGLSQLHQLRGRVGRGAEQSFCILSSSFKLTSEARTRLETMVKTNDGFEIAEVDLRLRGPGDMGGTQQSGIVDFKLADLVKDEALITTARNAVYDLLREDPRLEAKENFVLKKQLHHLFKDAVHWSRIS